MVELSLHEYITLLPPMGRKRFLCRIGMSGVVQLTKSATGLLKIPPRKAMLIEEVTFGLVPRHLTCPEAYDKPYHRCTGKKEAKFAALVMARAAQEAAAPKSRKPSGR